MEHIGKHMAKRGVPSADKRTERGELMRYFLNELNRDRIQDGYKPMTMPYMGRLLQKIPTKDLYYLKRVCDDAKNFSKKFWWEVNPKKHKDDA